MRGEGEEKARHYQEVMPRIMFPYIPMRMVVQPKNLLRANTQRMPSAKLDPRSSGEWDKIVLQTPLQTSKFELKQYLSKVYGLEVMKVNTINYEGKGLAQTSIGRKQFWMRRYADYKKAYVTVKRRSGWQDAGDSAPAPFQIPLMGGVMKDPELGKFKKNQPKWRGKADRELLGLAFEAQRMCQEEDYAGADEILAEIDDTARDPQIRRLAGEAQEAEGYIKEEDIAQIVQVVRGTLAEGGGNPGRTRARKGRNRTGKRQSGRPNRHSSGNKAKIMH